MKGQRPNPTTFAQTQWDLIVIGGGITGAGILQEAARLGLKALLVEQRDYAWGTSSRSSKMVHGGLRYLSQGDFRLTRHSLLERERLIGELPNLVVRKDYLFPVRKGVFPGRWALKGALWLYDFLAGIRDHCWLSRAAVLDLAPELLADNLRGGMIYTDALTDDTRLVMRVLHDATSRGAHACNYLKVEHIDHQSEGFNLTVTTTDSDQTDTFTLSATHVINATGAWADNLSAASERVRPQRGSHLFVPSEKLPVKQCFTLLNPVDQRPIFVFPWEGRTCIGTTDIDHKGPLDLEPHCTDAEIDYLLQLINVQFPAAQLGRSDIISTMAGVRPIIASGKGVNPSAERRDHAVWKANGIVSVSGGKLTTFRLIALDALHVAGLLSDKAHKQASASKAKSFNPDVNIFGTLGQPLAAMPEGEALRDTVHWVLNNEQVVHLDDLMLRRTRLGNLLAEGGLSAMPVVRDACQKILGWNDRRWQQELSRYHAIIETFYGVSLPSAANASATTTGDTETGRSMPSNSTLAAPANVESAADQARMA